MRSYRRKKTTAGSDKGHENMSNGTDAGGRTDAGSKTDAGSRTDADRRTKAGGKTEAGRNRVFETVAENLSYLKNKIGTATDLVENMYEISGGKLTAGFAYISAIADKDLISRNVLAPLMGMDEELNMGSEGIMAALQARIPATDTFVTESMKEVINALLEGNTAFFADDSITALIIGSEKITKRAIEKPENESTILGSQESFTDNLDTNISLIIKRLPVKELKFEAYEIGRLSRTSTRLIWLDGIINTKIIDEVKRRIGSVDVDNITGVGEFMQLIEDRPGSIFPKYRQTERPDAAVRFLSNGCFAIICNNSPYALIAPFTLWDNFKTIDDYEEQSLKSSYLRVVRYIAFLISIFITPLYLSFVTYNHTVVPQPLAVNFAAGREGVPFPSVIEVIALSFIMSIVREAGLRMPQSTGYFIGTLAAVLIGQAIVTAGYVSASLIIVIAISTISGFAISSTTLLYTSRMMNYFYILFAAVLGVFGLTAGFIITTWHLLTLRSFGLPYLYPVIPFDAEQWKDTYIRAQTDNIRKRPRILSPYNRIKNRE